MDFLETFNASLDQAEKEMGEPFFIEGVQWQALEIEELTAGARATPGGAYTDVSTSITVSKQTAALSGVKRGTKLTARGVGLRVSRTEVDGDAAVTLLCGPAGVEMPRLR
jgi:hypothetical protein